MIAHNVNCFCVTLTYSVVACVNAFMSANYFCIIGPSRLLFVSMFAHNVNCFCISWTYPVFVLSMIQHSVNGLFIIWTHPVFVCFCLCQFFHIVSNVSAPLGLVQLLFVSMRSCLSIVSMSLVLFPLLFVSMLPHNVNFVLCHLELPLYYLCQCFHVCQLCLYGLEFDNLSAHLLRYFWRNQFG